LVNGMNNIHHAKERSDGARLEPRTMPMPPYSQSTIVVVARSGAKKQSPSEEH
jgi:hypothetical protein